MHSIRVLACSLPLLAFCTTGALTAADPASSPVNNLIPYGDFEDDTLFGQNGLPKGMDTWTDVQDRPIATVTIAQDEKASGNNSLKIERIEKPGNMRVSIITVEVEPGQKYRVSCMGKATEGKLQLYVWPRGNTPKESLNGTEIADFTTTTFGAQVAGGNRLDLAVKDAENPEGFNKLEATFTIPDGVHYISVQATFSHTLGTAWYDDFQLELVE